MAAQAHPDIIGNGSGAAGGRPPEIAEGLLFPVSAVSERRSSSVYAGGSDKASLHGLHGSIVADRSHRLLYVSKPLRAVLEPPDASRTAQTLFDLLSPLLEEHGSTGSGALREWLTRAILAAPDRPPRAFQFATEPVAKKLQLEYCPLSDQSYVLHLEELNGGRDEAENPFATLYRDRLTGAANRVLFESKLDAAIARLGEGEEDNVTILFADLDRFKAVNDTLGHPVGDALLGVVAERLRTGLRETDTLARLGGDEFAILLPGGISPDRVTQLAQRLIDLLKRPYLVDGHLINVGASMGAARAPEDGATRNQLVRSADLALYHSKSAGRGAFHFFSPAMEERAQQRRAIEIDLRKALVLRQFELHYQPQIDVEKRTVIGLEGLLRWRHPQRGILLPADFLPLADEIGLAVPMGNWVIKTACKDAMAWPDAITVAVNISPAQFEDLDFAESTERALKAAGLPGKRLEIEVTEEILLRDKVKVTATLEALRAMGVRVAMDSFGTGLASLSQVVNFPFDKIKIDRSLIGGTAGNPKARAVLRAISALGQSLGIATLAEGVETPEHLASVRAEGCHSVQGFYYSKAVPVAELEAVLQALATQAQDHHLGSHHGRDTV